MNEPKSEEALLVVSGLGLQERSFGKSSGLDVAPQRNEELSR